MVIPGISGSVLSRDGRDIWAASPNAIWASVTSRGASLQDLQLIGSGDDGIRATNLMPSAHIVPGLIHVDGYSELMSMIEAQFEVVRDDVGQPLNLLPFPYDWRRDNREASHRLRDVLDNRLREWRRHPDGAADAMVIIIGHSMGGLVARYWAECLEGWRDCRALITFGTPHRGSPNTIGYLANGYKRMMVDLTAAMRSFPSVHQLLPRYPCVVRDGVTHRVTDLNNLPGVDSTLARDGYAFHKEIETAVATNDSEHGHERYSLLPYVGAGQPTIQSARLESGLVTVTTDLPPGLDPLLGDGDGTVPRASAIPIELSEAYRDTFSPERHGSLQVNTGILTDVTERIVQLQVRGLSEVRALSEGGRHAPFLALDIEDAYVDDEPVRMTVQLNQTPASARPSIAITSVETGGLTTVEQANVSRGGDLYSFEIAGLEEGLYRVEASAVGAGSWSPPAVHDIFAMVK